MNANGETAEGLQARISLAERIDARLGWIGLLSNGIGALIVFLFFIFLVPDNVSSDDQSEILLRSAIGFTLFMAASLPFGRRWAGEKPFEPIREWLTSGRQATDAVRRAALHYPAVWALRSSTIWATAAIVFAGVNASLGPVLFASIVALTALGGVTANTLQYLMVERVMRPVTALALAGSQPEQLETPGVAARLTIAWALATGVALLGILIFAVTDLAGADLDRTRLVGAIAFLALVGLAAGATGIRLAANSVADSLGGLRAALERIERRDFDARVEVDDGSEVGLLQAGFNSMAAGLAERERIREAFGAYVDPEIAEHIINEGTDLSGDSVEATILFLDVRDFTSWAERAPAGEVVAMLNRLFEVAVPIVHEQGGHIDKFVGDGLMAVFGAPRRQHDHADRALAAAVEIAELVGDRFESELRIGLGLSSGTVVAGNVGGAGRLDFSVIGDAVNVAARVEAATRETGDTILLTEETRKRLTKSTLVLEDRAAMPLKGKSDPVLLFAPAWPG